MPMSSAPSDPYSNLSRPFCPLAKSTVTLAVGPVATGAGKVPLIAPAVGALPSAGTVTAVRVRNAAASAFPVTFLLTADPAAVPVVPAALSVDGTGGARGDATIDPGGVEVIGLTADQQAALAVGNLFVSAITPSGGSATLSVTPGFGA